MRLSDILSLTETDKFSLDKKKEFLADDEPLEIEIDEDQLDEQTRMAWARKGRKLVRKIRCGSGRRKGRLVSKANQCGKAINLKRRFLMRRLLKRKGAMMRRKALRTKRTNPLSRRLRSLNKRKKN
jgi:hypothetical protein